MKFKLRAIQENEEYKKDVKINDYIKLHFIYPEKIKNYKSEALWVKVTHLYPKNSDYEFVGTLDYSSKLVDDLSIGKVIKFNRFNILKILRKKKNYSTISQVH